MPPLMVVRPVSGLTSDSLSEPAPVWVRARAPLTRPEKVLAPAVIDREGGGAAAVGHRAGADASVGQAGDRLATRRPGRMFRCRVTVSAVPVGKALATPSLSVPALTVVAPL